MKVLLAIFVLILIGESGGFIYWLEDHLLSCPFKKMTGLDCPGCGFQRSAIALVKGDIVNSFKLYPATIPFVGLLIFLMFHLKFDFKHGAYLLKVMYILVTSIIIINYIYKIYHHQLF